MQSFYIFYYFWDVDFEFLSINFITRHFVYVSQTEILLNYIKVRTWRISLNIFYLFCIVIIATRPLESLLVTLGVFPTYFENHKQGGGACFQFRSGFGDVTRGPAPLRNTQVGTRAPSSRQGGSADCRGGGGLELSRVFGAQTKQTRGHCVPPRGRDVSFVTSEACPQRVLI